MEVVMERESVLRCCSSHTQWLIHAGVNELVLTCSQLMIRL